MGPKLLRHLKVKSQSGFTLVELMVVIGITCVFILGQAHFLSKIWTDFKTIESSSNKESDLMIAYGTLIRRLNSAGPSFNRVQLPDDNNMSFYDLYEDIPESFLPPNQRQRTLTLRIGATESLPLLSSDSTQQTIIYEPASAYQQEPSPDLIADGVLTYKGINNILPDTPSHRILAIRPEISWAEGKFYMLTLPIPVRPLAALQNISTYYQFAPKYPTFFGRVEGNDLAPLTVPGINFFNLNPLVSTPTPYINPDTFFRRLPSVAGASPVVKLEAFNVVRIRLRGNSTYSDNTLGDLVFEVYDPNVNDYKVKDVVFYKVKSVKLTRASVTSPKIELRLEE